MTLYELTQKAREISDDLARPYKWSDDEWRDHANATERDAARRALLLMDVETSSVCSYDVSSGEALITLDPRVVSVRRIRLVGQARPLALHSWREVEEMNANWDLATGAPVVAIPDWKTDCLRLSPIPTANDTALAAVFRLPLADMVGDGDTPEINARYHLDLVNGMLARAYGKHEADCFNPQAATFYAGLFDAVFGPPLAASVETQAARTTDRSRHEG